MQHRLHRVLFLMVAVILAACAPLGVTPQAALLSPVSVSLPASAGPQASDLQPASATPTGAASAITAAVQSSATRPAALPTLRPAAEKSEPPFQPTPKTTLLPGSQVSTSQKNEIHKALNLAYAQSAGVDAQLQMLDIYYADPLSVRRPVMIFIHGGGWTSGDKAPVGVKPQFFVQAGYVFVSINYRLSPAARFPAHVQDVAAAIAWTVKHIGQYGGDGSRIFVGGHSAGGHLAVLVASDERYLKAQGLDLTAVKAVVAIDTAGYDFSIFASRCKNHVLPEPYSIPFGQDPAVWKMASPDSYVQAGKHIPPMALIYSGDVGIGSDVRRELMTEEFAAKLSAASILNVLIGAPEKDHGQINNDFGLPGDAVSLKTLEFLKKIN
jgi:acetyl esterase/lipase